MSIEWILYLIDLINSTAGGFGLGAFLMLLLTLIAGICHIVILFHSEVVPKKIQESISKSFKTFGVALLLLLTLGTILPSEATMYQILA